MKKMMKSLIALPLLAVFSTVVNATPSTDVQDYSNNTGNEYFLDIDANKYDSPYYRGQDEDWGWVHNGISGTFTDAKLNISAFDVDYTPGERDKISVWDGSSWFGLGDLAGGNAIWAFTTFDLTPYLGTWATTQINSGLQVAMDIDTGGEGWIVTLAKSTLSVNGGNQQCVPQPGVPCVGVPGPSVLALLVLGLACMGMGSRLVRRRQA